MRGEDGGTYLFRQGYGGSPPHARGRLDGLVNHSFSIGDHPRMRGEDGTESQVSDTLTRITPACAGKTFEHRRPQCRQPDHPRMRGEDASTDAGFQLVPGSPPHARGRLVGNLALRLMAGITPACAGKTTFHWLTRQPVKDHPRMRGEDHTADKLGIRQQGSPPHARGRRPDPHRLSHRRRITPACAGKTKTTSPNGSPARDHPRMRGEDKRHVITVASFRGSPPHARGRPVTDAEKPVNDRITPACAGKT